MSTLQSSALVPKQRVSHQPHSLAEHVTTTLPALWKLWDVTYKQKLTY